MSYNSDIDKLNRVTDTLSSVIRNLKITNKNPVIDVSSEISRCRNELTASVNVVDDIIVNTGVVSDYLSDLEIAINLLEKKLKGDGQEALT